MTDSQPSTMQRIFSRNMLICIFTGFTSGLPLYFLYSLIPAWLRLNEVNLKTIGLFALIGFPYTWKFIWSPLLDSVRLPFLGLRRGWMFGDADRAFAAFWLPMRLSARKNICRLFWGCLW